MAFACLPFNGESPSGFGIRDPLLAFCRCCLIIFVYIGVLLRFLIENSIVFMGSAGKRHGALGGSREKRRLDH